MPSDSSGWQSHERDQRRAWLGLSPAQRLAWLWQAKQFARVAMGRARPSASKHATSNQEPAAAIRDSEVRPEDLVARLRDPVWRAALVAACATETGSRRPFCNAFDQAARRAAAAADELRAVVEVLLAEGREEFVEAFAVHPEMPEDVLLALCRAGRCVSALGHRGGPRPLLVEVVAQHGYPEAVLTLAIDLYRDPVVPAADFARFVDSHSENEWMLRALAGCDPSDAEKLSHYENLLDAAVGAEAVVFHGAHRAASQAWTAKQLAAWLDRHPSSELLLTVLRTEPSSPDKRAVVEAHCARHQGRDEIRREISRRAQIAEAAGEALDPVRAEALFASGDVDIQMALAGNRVTSRSLLEAMSAFRATPGARAIRARAQATLRGR